MMIRSAKGTTPFFVSVTRRQFAHWKIEHTVPLYERRSRAKLKREKLLKKAKIQVLHLGRSARLEGGASTARVGSTSNTAHLGSSSYTGHMELPHGAIRTEDPHVKELPELKMEQLNASSLTFTHAKRLFLIIRRKGNEALLKHVNNEHLVHVCVFMVKKNVRCRPVEEEFLRRVGYAVGEEVGEEVDGTSSRAAASPPGDPLLRADNLYHVLEFIHHIGLNNVSVRQSGYHAWGFTKLKRIYNALLSQITNKMILSKGDVMEVLRINDKYLHFDECLFDYIDGTIESTFDTYDEHEVASLCRHLNKILFLLALQRHGIKCDLKVHRLVKRYVCKSLVFSPEAGQEKWEEQQKWQEQQKSEGHRPWEGHRSSEAQLGDVVPPHVDDPVARCPEASPPSPLHTFRERIRKSSLVKTLNKELSKSAHEYKYYNLVELLEFYSLFQIRRKGMVKRLINEVDKYINIMKYGYHAKALILFSLNRKHLDEENQKSIRRLIRRTSQMLHFYWPVEFILETIIACCSFLDKGNKTMRNLFLYLKGNIKKCVHPVLLVNFLKSLAATQIQEWTVCNQIVNYVKEKKDFIDEIYVVQILKYLSVLNYPNDELFVSFLTGDRVLSRFSRLPSESLVNLLHVVNHYRGVPPSGGEKDFRLGNILVRSCASVFFSEYVMFLLLSRRGTTKRQGMENTVEERTNHNVHGEVHHNGGTSLLQDVTSLPKEATSLPQDATSPPHADAFVQLLNALTNLKITNLDMLHYALSYLQGGGLPCVEQSHVVTLFQFFSEHLINCPSAGESLTREIYTYLHQVAKKTIMKLPEEYLIHCAFSVLAYYFVDIVLNKNKKNVDLLEKMMIIFGHKIRAGLNLLTEENEEKKASSELMHVISAVLKLIYEKIEKRLPDELFTLCTHVQKHLTAIGGEAVKAGRDQKIPTGQHFIFFFSDLFKSKKIPHFVNYFSYPYTIDIVIPGWGDKGGLGEESRQRALFLIDSFDQMYLRNVPVGRFFGEVGREQMGKHGSGQMEEQPISQMEEQRICQMGKQRDDPTREHRTGEVVYQNEDVRTCLKPYEAIREWFLNSHNYAVSYVSVADWESKYM
ncbi:hypothetical protein C922_03429 [Plasmodium inui San Antonio 1]|uniref:Uncharacterized protein n=1 Tax=Plasmodium inui San Antonio 1 TaxID=1237626 RepID=W7AAY2_9APIC|nr:hypothetical protein C922_03429 [Plasmodium inui San Antonio 1]EUD66234.1 hypothetical protein C922_03429 [Plasmodium inui San Antonio 1]